jgi:hypothetical protein
MHIRRYNIPKELSFKEQITTFQTTMNKNQERERPEQYNSDTLSLKTAFSLERVFVDSL